MRHRQSTAAGLALVALLLAAATARAELACADPKSHEFDFWIGNWEVSLTVGAKPVGFNRITPILDGCVLQENWRGVSDSSGTSLNFYDTQRKRWRQLWVWREGTTLELEGALSGDRMIMEGDSRDPDGSVSRNRITWFNNADGTVRQFWEVSKDAGKTWRTEFDGMYRKAG